MSASVVIAYQRNDTPDGHFFRVPFRCVLMNQYPRTRPDLWDSMRAMTGTAIQFPVRNATYRGDRRSTLLAVIGPRCGLRSLFLPDLILTQRKVLVGNETT